MKIIMMVNMLCVAAMMAFLAVVGPIIRALGMAEWHAGVTVTFAGVVWVVMARYWGKKSDIVGRKPILTLGVLGVGVSYLMLAMYVDYGVAWVPAVMVSLFALMGTRALIGLFYAAIPAVSNALIADKIAPNLRTAYMAKLGASNGLGMILGPAVGGYLAVYVLSTPLYFFAVLPLVGAGLVYAYIPSSPKATTTEVSLLGWFDERLRLPMIAAFLTMYGVVTSQVCLGFFVMDALGFNAIEASKATGIILSCVGVSFIAIQVIVSKVMFFSPLGWIRLGAGMAALGYVVVSSSVNVYGIGVGFCVGAVGLGMLFPSFQALAANGVKPSEQGAAAGTLSSVQGMGMIVGPLASTALYGVHPTLPFWVTAAMFGVLVVVSLLKRYGVAGCASAKGEVKISN